MSLASHTLDSAGRTTRYLECGPDDGPLMIFLHGWPGIGLLWRAQLDAFAADGWRCIAPDLRGFGGSSAPPARDEYTIEQVVTDMAELHDHLGARPAIWVGHDWGCVVVGQLFVNGDFDQVCTIADNRLGDPMRASCTNLTVTSLPAGHWLPLERKAELVRTIRAWLRSEHLC